MKLWVHILGLLIHVRGYIGCQLYIQLYHVFYYSMCTYILYVFHYLHVYLHDDIICDMRVTNKIEFGY